MAKKSLYLRSKEVYTLAEKYKKVKDPKKKEEIQSEIEKEVVRVTLALEDPSSFFVSKTEFDSWSTDFWKISDNTMIAHVCAEVPGSKKIGLV